MLRRTRPAATTFSNAQATAARRRRGVPSGPGLGGIDPKAGTDARFHRGAVGGNRALSNVRHSAAIRLLNVFLIIYGGITLPPPRAAHHRPRLGDGAAPRLRLGWRLGSRGPTHGRRNGGVAKTVRNSTTARKRRLTDGRAAARRWRFDAQRRRAYTSPFRSFFRSFLNSHLNMSRKPRTANARRP
jgi:hypothetical protein